MDNTRLVRLRALMTLVFDKATAWGFESPSFLRYEQIEFAYLEERDRLAPRYWDRDARLNRLIDAIDTAWHRRLLSWEMTEKDDARYRARFLAVEDALSLEKVATA